jgi:hypothetical protein
MALPITVNRRLWAWSSQEFSLIRGGAAEELITPIRALDYSDSANPTVVMAAGALPYGFADGTYVPGSMSITLLSAYHRDVTRRITSNGAVQLSTVDLRLVVKYSNGPTEDPSIDEIDFRMTEVADSSAHSTGDARETVITCMPILIRRSGVIT